MSQSLKRHSKLPNTSTQPKVVSVILTYNEYIEPIKCYNSIQKQTYDNHEIIVVDNGSDPLIYDKLCEALPSNVLVRIQSNCGYSAGMNVGLREAIDRECDYVWMLNNDVYVPARETLSLLVSESVNKSFDLCTPVIIDNHDKNDIKRIYGVFYDKLFNPIALIDAESYQQYSQEPNGYLCLPGTSLLVRKTVIEKVGYLDEAFFIQWDDIDYSIRSSRMGFNNGVAIDLEIKHGFVPGVDRGSGYHYYDARNQLGLIKKHLKGLTLLKNIYWTSYRLNRTMLFMRQAGRSDAEESMALGIFDAFMNRRGPRDNLTPNKVEWYFINILLVIFSILFKR